MNYKPYSNLSDAVANAHDINADSLQTRLHAVKQRPQTDIIVADEVE